MRRVWPPALSAKPLVPRLRIAVIAGRAHLRAADPRVEGVVRPFDAAVLSHFVRPSLYLALSIFRRCAYVNSDVHGVRLY